MQKANIIKITTLNIIGVAVLLILLFASAALANPTYPESDAHDDADMISPDQNGVYFKDLKNVFTSPSRWTGAQWRTAAIISGAAVVLYNNDLTLKNQLQKNDSGSARNLSFFGEKFGNGYYLFPALGIGYLYGNRIGDQKLKRTISLSFESIIITGSITTPMKLIGHRHRPNESDDPNLWDGLSLINDHLSFPSGHAAVAFSVATVFAKSYQDSSMIPPLVYSIASLTALSRVYDNKHWPSDVFIGSVIGCYAGKMVFDLNMERSITKGIIPIINQDSCGLAFYYRF